MVLDALPKLRQSCCDPRLVKLSAARKVRSSAKLEALMGMLEELIPEGPTDLDLLAVYEHARFNRRGTSKNRDRLCGTQRGHER